MSIEILKVGQLSTNCYLFYEKESPDCFIIDPGDDSGFIINKIKDLELEPKAILATHGHFDHVLGLTELKLAFNIPFYLHKADLPILKRTQSTAKYFLNTEVDPPLMPDKFLKDGQVLKTGKLSLKTIHTPGHTQGSVCFYSKKQNLIFVGDLIFANGSYGRTDLKGGDFDVLQKSIKKILKLPEKTIIYPGHENITSVKKEKEHY